MLTKIRQRNQLGPEGYRLLLNYRAVVDFKSKLIGEILLAHVAFANKNRALFFLPVLFEI